MNENIKVIKKIIETEVFIPFSTQMSFHENGEELGWIFDFRKVFMRAEVLSLLSDIFWEKFKDRAPFQIGCLEVAGIPLVTAYALKCLAQGRASNAFFIRKSRKKSGLLNMVEGEIMNEKIILVDDILNSGKSFMRQVEVIESLGKRVDIVYTLLRYRDESFYTYFQQKGIKIESLFTLDDFKESLKVGNFVSKPRTQVPLPFEIKWSFRSEKPNFFYVLPKSAPVIDDKKLYFGSDSGNFWALHQDDGSVAWKYKVGLSAKGKSIFSSPAVSNKIVYFGAYDGNFYALDTETGKVRWIFMEADWIGSSPCIAPNLQLVYVGLEFGLFTKRGSIVALQADSGKKVWEYTVPGLVHASPLYVKEFAIVACGSNNSSVYALDAKSGKLLWEFKTKGEIKESLAYDAELKIITFGSFDANLYILDLVTGTLRHVVATGAAIYSTPVIYCGNVYVASLDKNIYCISIKSGEIIWKFATNGRIFSSPEVIDGKIYIGSNDGGLYELDALTGEQTAFFQATERITNKIAYNKLKNCLFVPTYANEIFCLTKK